MKLLMRLSFIVFLLFSNYTEANEIDPQIWSGVSSFFDRLDEVFSEMQETQADMEDIISILVHSTETFKNRDKKRRDVFSCINTKFKNIETEIAKCEAQQIKNQEKGDLAKAKLIAQIEALRNTANLEIEKLSENIENSELDIEETKAALASLTQMNDEAVDAAISKLADIKDGYSVFSDKRLTLVQALRKMIKRLKAYNFTTNKEIDTMQESYCIVE